ncbi:MAG TPA: glycosyltransferase family 4 protein [Planctomycetes bacterium]|nr:glycosyltransferase family 4 protein [Planctomycetota bacterium]
MHILYIHQYFTTPHGMGVTRAYDFSRLWIENGHKVTMLTTTAKLEPNDLENARGRFLKRFNVDGINVLAFNIPYSQVMDVKRRYLAWFMFLLTSVIVTLCVRKIDLVYARSSPLTVGIPAILSRIIKRVPFVFEVTDQWPEIPIEVGILKNKIMIKLLLWLEKTIYRFSSSIIACSPGMADGVRDVIVKNKLKETPITVIPNFCETHLYRPDIDGSKVRKEQGWCGKTVFLHAGTMGTLNSLDFVIDAALRLKDHRDILFVLIGRGNKEQVLRDSVEKFGLTNVQILTKVLKKQLPPFLAAADVSLVIFADYPILEHNSANKFFDALSAGNPVLLNYSGWQRDVLEANNAGFGCRQYNIEEFVEKVLWFRHNKEKLADMGSNARALAEEEFDKEKLCVQALKVVNNVATKTISHSNIQRAEN